MKWVPSDYFRNNVALRNDTILGVCEALGQDLRINPNFLRVPLAAGIIFAPLVMLGVYFGLGLVVLASRSFFPDQVERIAVAEPVAERDSANAEIALPQAA